MLRELTIGGLHDFLIGELLSRHVPRGRKAVDLGAGTGALATRLRQIGWDVLAIDGNRKDFEAEVPFVELDLNQPDFAARLGESFDLVTAVEVIEHLENPISFLRNVRRLIGQTGMALVTTPNVDNAPARVKFLVTGRVRMMDTAGDPTHISPIFWDLLQRQYLPRADLQLVEYHHYPARGYKVTRRSYGWAIGAMSVFMGGECLDGDNHVLLLRGRG